ncbi:hypothetical protein PGT21_005755 [Puccinia graminis f. sp. tritici]|uniref:DH domain-containing protein n=1 Tax=Puccinia graminis f. sp. tritici TaxID=56615 RepID=A0A5B0NY02_PUCGR|nr:hypothetical protein PGT21_005755 [Puccinia graminis f. sp. tritici]KAA1093622.1 hypothetical protein PGTUg99_009621 [Puccinia graminis f. sp. tritici]
MNHHPHQQHHPPLPPHQQHQQQQQQPPPHIDFLFDLIRTEKTFANDLFTIINRIASAYSPTNFPPVHLDRHFRLIESIFRAHNSFLSQSILPIDPPQPNYHLLAFVSLFNQLIRHLLPAYHRYCHPSGWAGAGGWSRDPHVNSNHLLIQTLLSLDWPGSLSLPTQPPTHTAPAAAPSCPPIFPEAPYPTDDLLLYDSDSAVHASLTVFFALPFARLFYYRKLSQFLLQILQHGRPEHKAVYDSAHQISLLLDRGRAQWNISPLHFISPSQPPSDPLPNQALPTAQASLPAGQQSPPRRVSPVPPASPSQTNSTPVPPNLRSSTETALSGLAESSIGSTTDEVFDQTNPSTPLSSSSATFEAQQQATFKTPRDMVQVNRGVFVQQAILNLQTQLDTSRCLDVFSMAPKQCRLLLAPPTLAYSRSLRYSGDAKFKIRPQSDPNREIETTSGRLILITDLLMFCEYKEQSSPQHPNMWLMYPPLAGKHLQVTPVGNDSEFGFDVVAMGKAVIRVCVSSQTERDAWVQNLQEAIEFGRQVSLQKQVGSMSPENQTTHDENRSSLKNPKLSALSSLSINGIPPRLGTQSQPISPSFSHKSERPPSSFSAYLEHQTPQLSPPCPGQYSRSPSDAGGSLANQMASHSLSPPPNAHQHPAASRDRDSRERGDFPSHRMMNMNGASGQPLRSPGMYSDSHRSQTGSVPSHSAGEGAHPGQTAALRTLRKAPSAHALGARFDPRTTDLPPMPTAFGQSLRPSEDRRAVSGMPGMMDPNSIRRSTSTEPYRDRQYRPPSAAISRIHDRPPSGATSVSRSSKLAGQQISGYRSDDSDSIPPSSPQESSQNVQSILVAEMKTKVFLKQSHSQWKSLGTAKLHLFVQKGRNSKQLVVATDKGKTLISTIVLTDGIERVGRTGVAVDISDRGVRTGIVYMLQPFVC